MLKSYLARVCSRCEKEVPERDCCISCGSLSFKFINILKDGDKRISKDSALFLGVQLNLFD